MVLDDVHRGSLSREGYLDHDRDALLAALRDADVLVLSPHLDDALFSAHSLITESVRGSGSTSCWTVFAGVPDDPTPTDWDRRCGYDDARELVEDRRAEDMSAFAEIPGVTVEHLDMLERAYSSADQRRADLVELGRRIDQWLASTEGSRRIIVLPVGAGTTIAPGIADRARSVLARCRGDAKRDGAPAEASDRAGAPVPSDEAPSGRQTDHRGTDPFLGWVRRTAIHAGRSVLHADFRRRRASAQRQGMLANEDHVMLRDAVLEHLASCGTNTEVRDGKPEVWFYEELPYLWGRRGDGAAAAMGAMCGPLIVCELGVDREKKAAVISRYGTQIALMDPGQRRLESAATLPATERVWRPADSPMPTLSAVAGSCSQPHGIGGGPQKLLPGVSVIIPAHNVAPVIGMQLEALARQIGATPQEVIIVDNRSTDDLRRAATPWDGVFDEFRILRAQQRAGAAYARNLGVGAARHEYLAFCDGDDVVSAYWLRDLLRELADNAAVSGSARPMASGEFTSVLAVQDRLDETEGEPIVSRPAPADYPILMAGDCGFRSELLQEMQGFDESFAWGGEDNDLALRLVAAGHTLIQTNGARLAYRERPTVEALLRRDLQSGFMHARLATRHRMWRTSPHLGRYWYLEIPRTAGALLLMAARMKPRDFRGAGRRMIMAVGVAAGFVWYRLIIRRIDFEEGSGLREGQALRERRKGPWQ